MSDVEEMISRKDAIMSSLINLKADKATFIKEIRGVVSGIPALVQTCIGFQTMFYQMGEREEDP